MDANINLLAHKKGNIFSSERTLARVRLIAVSCVGLLISSGIGAFLLTHINTPESLKAQQTVLTQQLMQSKNTAVAQLELLDRLNHIQTIINNRSSLQDNIAAIEKQIPDGMTVNTLELDSKQLNMSVSSPDLTAIDKLISNMTNLLHAQKIIKSMTITDVSADQKTGRYILSIGAKL